MAFPWTYVAAGSVAIGALLVVADRVRDRPVGRVALIGDSYAAGLGPELTKLIPGLRFDGLVGESSAHRAAELERGVGLVPSFRPDVTLVSLGVNDGSGGPAPLQRVVRALHGLGSRVVWLAPPAGVDAPVARQAIRSLGVETVPAPSTPLAADGLHPSSYAGWAREIATALGVA